MNTNLAIKRILNNVVNCACEITHYKYICDSKILQFDLYGGINPDDVSFGPKHVA